MKKKVDSRIRTLVENGVKERFRSMFVIVGDKGRDQVVNLHYMLSKAVVKARPSVLWCYKKELGFSSHRQKRMRQIKKQIQRGLLDPDKDDPFELFISSTQIRYCYYAETHKILGNTYGMLVLQDFEALTPNILARTVETVEGGGIVVLLLRTMKSLRQLYTMAMDVHARLRTEAHRDVVARFNERFLLSLAACQAALVLDDELNVLPLSDASRSIAPLPAPADGPDAPATPEAAELKELQASLKETAPVGRLVACCRTLDQARAVLTFAEAISEKSLRSTVALTAARGRGKSAALGLAVAAAVAYGYGNVFVTSPSPENLAAFWEFLLKGFDALDYQEHLDYEVQQSTNPDFNRALVRANIFRSHRQTVQYISPQDAGKLGQAELLVVDEAAAIPLPLVQKLLGPYLLFMASTVTGYEGTGRALSLKLIQQLKQTSTLLPAASTAPSPAPAPAPAPSGGAARAQKAAAASSAGSAGRVFREIRLEEPIRYAKGDPVEAWLHELLCLDAASHLPRLAAGLPHPSACEIYLVDRDTLFSRHRAAEAFLQRLVALFVASHYKNSPNDLQLMSDAPAHAVFVLLGPQPADAPKGALPDILVAIQVCLEGEISRESVQRELARGQRSAGDLIPWTLVQQFQDPDFAKLSGARVVRIATHPDLQRMGYGQRALELLGRFYQGELLSPDAEAPRKKKRKAAEEEAAEGEDEGEATLLTETIAPRKKLPPLLQRAADCAPDRLHYLGTSFGLTLPLYNFWKKAGYLPVYLRLTPNDLTGEHTCIMLRALPAEELEAAVAPDWLPAYVDDFRRRFTSLLAYELRAFLPALALSVLAPKLSFGAAAGSAEAAEAEAGEEGGQQSAAHAAVRRGLGLDAAGVRGEFSGYDLRRLESYAKNMVDYHVVVDLLPALGRLYFTRKIPVSLSYAQAAILLSTALQHKSIDAVCGELNLPSTQTLALFNKALRKMSTFFRAALEADTQAKLGGGKEAALPGAAAAAGKRLQPLPQSLEEELGAGGAAVEGELKRKRDELLSAASIAQYAVAGTEQEWAEALGGGGVRCGRACGRRGARGPQVKSSVSIKNAAADPAKRKFVHPSGGKGGKKEKGPDAARARSRKPNA